MCDFTLNNQNMSNTPNKTVFYGELSNVNNSNNIYYADSYNYPKYIQTNNNIPSGLLLVNYANYKNIILSNDPIIESFGITSSNDGRVYGHIIIDGMHREKSNKKFFPLLPVSNTNSNAIGIKLNDNNMSVQGGGDKYWDEHAKKRGYTRKEPSINLELIKLADPTYVPRVDDSGFGIVEAKDSGDKWEEHYKKPVSATTTPVSATTTPVSATTTPVSATTTPASLKLIEDNEPTYPIQDTNKVTVESQKDNVNINNKAVVQGGDEKYWDDYYNPNKSRVFTTDMKGHDAAEKYHKDRDEYWNNKSVVYGGSEEYWGNKNRLIMNKIAQKDIINSSNKVDAGNVDKTNNYLEFLKTAPSTTTKANFNSNNIFLILGIISVLIIIIVIILFIRKNNNSDTE